MEKKKRRHFPDEFKRQAAERVEDFEGLVILASNLRANIDGTFLHRRLNVIIRLAGKAGAQSSSSSGQASTP
jgi:hypothetical protein